MDTFRSEHEDNVIQGVYSSMTFNRDPEKERLTHGPEPTRGLSKPVPAKQEPARHPSTPILSGHKSQSTHLNRFKPCSLPSTPDLSRSRSKPVSLPVVVTRKERGSNDCLVTNVRRSDYTVNLSCSWSPDEGRLSQPGAQSADMKTASNISSMDDLDIIHNGSMGSVDMSSNSSSQLHRRGTKVKSSKGRREVSLERTSSNNRRVCRSSVRTVTTTSTSNNNFHKTFSQRYPDRTPNGGPELSTEDTAPGILKIFGESICPGATYKSVLAASSSSSQELVKEALDRYSISRRKAAQYVLCDVIGRFVPRDGDDVSSPASTGKHQPQGLWTEYCIRIIGDNERPLVLQSFWKPTEGYLRRFEIRRRSQLLAMENVDTTTSGINANARRLLMTKSKSLPSPEILTDTGIHSDADTLTGNGRDGHVTDDDIYKRTCSSTSDSERSDHNFGLRMRAPVSHCYLLTIIGFSNQSDMLLYPLDNATIIIGCDPLHLSSRDIQLTAPDILPQHCLLQQQNKNQSAMDTVNPLPCIVNVILTPIGQVQVNGCIIRDSTVLRTGDFITLGHHYTFVFKNPREDSQVGETDSRIHPKTNTDHSLWEDDFCQEHDDVTSDDNENETERLAFARWQQQRKTQYVSNKTRLKITYDERQELELLTAIVEEGKWSVLTPVHLLVMMTEYSAVKYSMSHTNQLLVTIANQIQKHVWGLTKNLAERQKERCAQSSSNPDIVPIIKCLITALEFHHYLKTNLAFISCEAVSSRNAPTTGEESLRITEEVIRYSFQQMVYYLTKRLYMVLPALLESNPFQHAGSRTTTPATDAVSMDDLLDVLNCVLHTVEEMCLHELVFTQLVAYLIFFTNTSLVNTTLNAGSKYLNWHTGVQLRGNLDLLENWLAENELFEVAVPYLTKLTCLANILATPKQHLLQCDWKTFKKDYSLMSPAQIHHILSHYQLGPVKIPQHWSPQDKIEGEIQESFGGHPPFMIPDDGFQLNLNSNQQRDNKPLLETIEQLRQRFQTKDDDTDSGLSDSLRSPPSLNEQQHCLERTMQSISSSEKPNSKCQQHRSVGSGRHSDRSRSLVSLVSAHRNVIIDADASSQLINNTKARIRTDSNETASVQQNERRSRDSDRQYRSNYLMNPLSDYPQQQNNSRKTHSFENVRGTNKSHASNENPSSQGKSVHFNEPLYTNYPHISAHGDTHSEQNSTAKDIFLTGHKRSRYVTDDVAAVVSTSMNSLQSLTRGQELDKAYRYTTSGPGDNNNTTHPDDHHESTEADGPQSSPPAKERPVVPPLDLSELQLSDQEANQKELNPHGGTTFSIVLTKYNGGLGLGIIDGLYTPLKQVGVYVRTLVIGGVAERNGRLGVGDRLLAVNGTNIMEANYTRAMQLIRNGGEHVRLLVAKGSPSNRQLIMEAPC